MVLRTQHFSFIGCLLFAVSTLLWVGDRESFQDRTRPIRVEMNSFDYHQSHFEKIRFVADIFQIDTTNIVLKYDSELEDRGITYRRFLNHASEVRIGPNAFDTPALLASTLAHEIEIHAQQNLYKILLMDALGMEGTLLAEREAYIYEMKNARRFSLDPIEEIYIQDTMNYFYPYRIPQQKWSQRFKNYLTVNFLTFLP